ncbi:MAG TPA: hypothetical protein PK198_17825 [Saprospiraceae bacterium]|nr:hypothetical protein [Saprospiraceae bacterium]HRK80209.1 hypothetical protein [Saprospiraceae bacterium]
MLTKEELEAVYKKFDDDKIVKLAMDESKSLREDAVPILEQEIIRRNLDDKLLEWIKWERNFFKGAELESIKAVIKNSQCTECGGKDSEIKGFNIHYYSMFDSTFDANIIVCERCGKRARKKSYIKTATLGWISFYGIISVPLYFIGEIIASFSRENTSKEIIESFIFENTGLIREYGIENIRDLIYNSNLVQMKSDEITE